MMKITIENLGPIHKFEFDLEKDLHLIYGENGIGKSYAAYCIYTILKNFTDSERIKEYSHSAFHEFENTKKFKVTYEKLIQKLQKNQSKNIDIYEEAIELSKYILENTLMKDIYDSFLNTYSSISNLKNRFSDRNFKISIFSNDYTIGFINKDFQELEISDLKINCSIIAKYEKNEGDKPGLPYHLMVKNEYRLTKSVLTEEAFSGSLAEQLAFDVIRQFRKFIKNIYFLPASRSGLYQALNSFSSIIAELSKHRFYVKKSIEIPSLSEPIADYFIQLSAIENNRKNTTFAEIANTIETSVLKGAVNYNAATKKINFSPENTDLILDISNASSMVAELSPIVAYLKYIISSDEGYNVLILEEPEAHLHPEIQVRLMEIFAELTQHNIKVIMTSHSNYMFNKLGNLLLEKKVPADRVGIYHMVMTKKGSIVSDDMTSSEDGIEDHNFVEVSEQLYEERMKLYETAG